MYFSLLYMFFLPRFSKCHKNRQFIKWCNEQLVWWVTWVLFTPALHLPLKLTPNFLSNSAHAQSLVSAFYKTLSDHTKHLNNECTLILSHTAYHHFMMISSESDYQIGGFPLPFSFITVFAATTWIACE